MARAYRYMSGDSHLEIDSRFWINRVPEKHRHWAPQLIRLPNGGDAWLMNGEQVATANPFDLYGGQGREVWVPFAVKYETTPGTGTPEQRIGEQDRDGVDAETLFPAQVCGPRMLRRAKDDEAYRAIVRAYNDWLAEEYCAYSPDRLFGVGIIPWTGVDDAIAEMEHCAKIGLKVVLLGVYPSGGGYPTPEDDKFWAASLDLKMPLAIHVELDRNGERGGPLFRYPKEPDEFKSQLSSPVFGVVGQTARFARAGGLPAVQMTCAHVFDRFPALRILLAENSIGWVPFFLNMADIRYGRHQYWTEHWLGWEPLKGTPSDYINEYFYWGFQEDPVGVELRHRMNINRLVWGSDFPHQESEWPDSMGVIERNFADVPVEEKRKMVAGNLIDFLHLEDAKAVTDMETAAAD